jgi:hypothetical protein
VKIAAMAAKAGHDVLHFEIAANHLKLRAMQMPVFISGTTVLTLGEPWPGCFGYRPLVEVKMQRNMCSRRLKNGATSYYWRMPESAKRRGLPVHAEALGFDFVAAVRRATQLNELYGSFEKPNKIKAHCRDNYSRREFRAAA